MENAVAPRAQDDISVSVPATPTPDARAPRYTSYPTAVQFTSKIGATQHRAWLQEIPGEAPISLYLHVPYCRRLCWYCACNTVAANRPETVATYASLLDTEIRFVAGAIGRRLRCSNLHLGGGSPDSLAPASLEHLYATLRGEFAIDAEADIAAELDPAYLTDQWIAAAACIGLNRASLGVQTLAPHVQAAINRPQTLAMVCEATSVLRLAGVRSVNFDLMYGLPRQTTDDLRMTLEAMLSLRPERVAVFGYAHVPWMKGHQRLIDPADLPGAAERLEQSAIAAERLLAEGYLRIGLDHYALPTDSLAIASAQGRLRRNFQGYTTDQADTLIGFGASAISRLPSGYVQNQSGLREWQAAVGRGEPATARGVAFEGDDQLRAELIERLMCDGIVDIDGVFRRWKGSQQARALIWENLARFIALHWVIPEAGGVRLTILGRSRVREICTAFDSYFQPDGGRHSAAV